MRSGRYAEALLSYDRAVELDPDNATALIKMGIVFKKLSYHVEARVSRIRGIAFRDYTGTNSNKDDPVEQAYRSSNSPKTARLDLLEITKECVERGDELMRSGSHAEALLSYDRAVELDPDNAAAHIKMGFALEKLGRHAEARASHDRGIKLRDGA